MCLIALAYDPLASNQLIVTANRDEFHARPTTARTSGPTSLRYSQAEIFKEGEHGWGLTAMDASQR